MKRKAYPAFTLVELLVSIAVVAVLGTIVFSAYGQVIESAHRTKCASNIRSVYQAFQTYSVDHDNLWPPVASEKNSGGQWQFDIRPYIQNVLSQNRGISHFRGTAFECPAAALDLQERLGFEPGSVYRYGYGMNRHLPSEGSTHDTMLPKSIYLLEEPVRTVLLIENDNAIAAADRFSFIEDVSGRHGGTVNAVFADGHVRALELDEIPREVASEEGSIFWRGEYPK